MRCGVSAAVLLATAMDRAGLTNEALAKALDVRPSMVSMMRTGRMDIPVCRIAELARLLGVPVEILAAAGVASYPGSRTWQAFALGRALGVAA